jgi:hypothetical protein
MSRVWPNLFAAIPGRPQKNCKRSAPFETAPLRRNSRSLNLLATVFGLAALGALSTGCHRDRPVAPVAPVALTSVSSAGADFVDIAALAGLNYRWQIAGKRPLNILQTIGNGCAFLDYDGDGNLDILLVGPKVALYRGDGKGHFTDVSLQTGLSKLSGQFLGCAVGDFDNDGYPDIYLSGYRTGLLLHNDHGKAFTDVTRSAGLQAQPWGTSCSWAETVPGSGRLDLFVANYARFDSGHGIPQLCESRGIMTSCGPRFYAPLRGAFYRSLGSGRFARADQALAVPATQGRGLGAGFAPLDASGRPSLAIANDELPGDLLDPSGDGKNAPYVDQGVSSGVGTDRDGNPHGGMGLDWGDYDNDGRLDLFIATFHGEAKSLYHNDGHGTFTDSAYPSGLAEATIPNVAFGCKLFDYDNDGALDLILANGHVQDNIREIDSSASYRQPTQLFHNRGNRPTTFENVSLASGKDLQRPIVGRGLAVGDFDNDGRVDVLVVDSEGAPLLLHNETPGTGHWLGVKLVGTRSNRSGIGALITITIGGRKLMRLCHADGSYLSSSDLRVNFGLGAASKIDLLTVRWPSGKTDAVKDVPTDRYLTFTEGGKITAYP